MTEAVEILIKADDQASAKFAAVARNVDASSKQVNQSIKATTKNTKGLAEMAGVLANLTGNSQIAGFTSQIAQATEKVSQFSEVAKAGGAGALAFRLGIVGLVAAGAYAFGKVIADWIWQTAKFERAVKAAKEEAQALDAQLKQLAQNKFGERREDIELIRDPEKKRQEYEKLFAELQREISNASVVAQKSKRDAEEWADAWQITGDRKQYAEDAEAQAKADRERVDALKAQAQEVGKLIGQRAQQNALIAAENEAKDKSEAYLETLRKEVEYLAASREEQIKLDAARNTTAGDRGEAERLLRERDAIEAKAEAQKALADAQKKAQDDAAKAAQQAQEDADREIKRVKDLEKSIQERITLKQIELTQGKEAARVQELMNQGIDQTTAKRLAAQEAALAPEEKGKGGGPLGPLAAVEARLLTRGPGSQQDRWMEEAARSLRKIMETSTITATATKDSAEKLGFVEENTSNTTLMVPVT